MFYSWQVQPFGPQGPHAKPAEGKLHLGTWRIPPSSDSPCATTSRFPLSPSAKTRKGVIFGIAGSWQRDAPPIDWEKSKPHGPRARPDRSAHRTVALSSQPLWRRLRPYIVMKAPRFFSLPAQLNPLILDALIVRNTLLSTAFRLHKASVHHV